MKKALKVALELGHRYTGNLLKGIDNKTVRRRGISICLQMFSSHTVPIAEILSVKNARAWVSMVSYLKKRMKIKILKCLR